MAKRSAYDEARDLFGRVGAGAQSLYNRASFFVQQNPTPVSFVQKQIQPFQQYLQQRAQPVQRLVQQAQQRVAQTPILPFIPQSTPQNLMRFQAPGEQFVQKQISRLPQRLQQPVQSTFPITQVPSFVGENVRQAGRFAGLQPTALDIATAPFMFMGGVKAKPGISKKLSVISKDLYPVAQEARNLLNLAKQKISNLNETKIMDYAQKIAMANKNKSIQPQDIAEALQYREPIGNINQVKLENLFRGSIGRVKDFSGNEQYQRLKELGITDFLDPNLPNTYQSTVNKIKGLSEESRNLLRMFIDKMMFTNRKAPGEGLAINELSEINKIIGVAEKIKILSRESIIKPTHLAEALTYRNLPEYVKGLKPNSPVFQRLKEIFGSNFYTQATGGVPKALQPLAQEARKYKSAEEFAQSLTRGNSLQEVQNRFRVITGEGKYLGKTNKAMGEAQGESFARMPTKQEIIDFYTQATGGEIGTPSVVGKKYVADYVMPNGEVKQTKQFDTPGMAAANVEKGAEKYKVKSVSGGEISTVLKQDTTNLIMDRLGGNYSTKELNIIEQMEQGYSKQQLKKAFPGLNENLYNNIKTDMPNLIKKAKSQGFANVTDLIRSVRKEISGGEIGKGGVNVKDYVKATGIEIRPLRGDLQGKYGIQLSQLGGIPDKLANFNSRQEALNYIEKNVMPSTGGVGGLPSQLQPLAQEARKYKSAEEFTRAFQSEIKHGEYWHITDNPNFTISPKLGPRDLSSLASGKMEAGKLMVTSDIGYWNAEFPSRKFAAKLDFSNVKPEDYYQVNRGFGNEFFVKDPSKVRVEKVVPIEQALKEAEQYQKVLEKNIRSKSQLTDFYTQATGGEIGKGGVGGVPTRAIPLTAEALPVPKTAGIEGGARGVAGVTGKQIVPRSFQGTLKNIEAAQGVPLSAKAQAEAPAISTKRVYQPLPSKPIIPQFEKEMDAQVGKMPKFAPKPKPVEVPADVASQEIASVRGGAPGKPAEDVITRFKDWVNTRRASKVEGLLKKQEFQDLDNKGINGIFEFQSGTKTGRFGDVKKYYDTKYDDLEKNGVDMNYKQDYLPQLWANTQDQIDQVFGRSLGLRPSFTMESIIKNYEEGIKAGLTPKYKTVSDLVGWYEQRANKALADTKFFNFLGEGGFIGSRGKVPRDWKPLDPASFPARRIKTDKGVFSGQFYAPPELAEMINNYLSTPLQGNTLQRSLAQVANFVSAAKNRMLSFGIPGTGINFHGFNILARSYLEGGVKGALKTAYYMVNPNAAGKFFEANLSKAPDAVRSGLTFSTHEYANAIENTTLRSKFGSVWNNLFEKPLFQKIISAKKLEAWETVWKKYVEYMPENQAKSEAAKFVNTTYGGINWEELGRSRDIQNLFRVAALTPDWLESNLKLGLGMVKGLLNIKNPAGQAYRKAFTNLLAGYTGLNIINKMTSGHWMIENDAGHTFELEVGYTEDGQKRYYRPFGTAVDFVRLPVDIVHSALQGDFSVAARTVRNRLSTLIQPAVALTFNVNWKGQPVYGRDKYGKEMPISQQAGGVASELGTLVGFPSFLREGIDTATGKQGLEQGILQGMEFPFRYSGGYISKADKPVAESLGVKGKEKYELSKTLRDQAAFGENQLKSIQSGGREALDQIIQDRVEKKKAGEIKEYKTEAIKLLLQNDKEGAKKLVEEHKFQINVKDVKSYQSSQIKKAADLFILDQREEAKKIIQEAKVQLSEVEVKKAAKRKVIELFRLGLRSEAGTIAKKYGVTITPKDIQ